MSDSYYKHHVFFCTNLRTNGKACCQDHDAQRIRDFAKARIKELGLNGQGRVRINQAGCLDRCEQGPVLVIYPEETWYTFVDESDVEDIIQNHLVEGRVVDRLLLDPPQ